MTSQRIRATRRVGLVVDDEIAAVIGSVGKRQMWVVQSPLKIDPPRVFKELRASWVAVLAGTFRLSLVCPQPVALHRLNTGMRISSRIEGSPTMRNSPVCPL